MINKGRYKIVDNNIIACDYEYILSEIIRAIINKKKLLVSPIASHTLVRAHFNRNLKIILDKFDYLVPDSQWVRWLIPFIYGKRHSLNDRVYGPKLMLKVCKLSAKTDYRVFLYGNTKTVLAKLKKQLKKHYPQLEVAKQESKFRELTNKEWTRLLNKISNSKSQIMFVSLGSPEQEVFSYNLSRRIGNPLIIIPVGAAFDFISKTKLQAPYFMQELGLEWLFRLSQEPLRLFKRYLIYGLLFILLIIQQKIISSFNYKK